MNEAVMGRPEAGAKPQVFADEATERAMAGLMEKVAPLLQGGRFNNIVDLASLVSDGVDMFDDAMVQKLMKAYEESVGAAWTLGNAARFSAAKTSTAQVPSLFGLLRLVRDEDARRGLYFMLTFLSVLGRQMKDDDVE